MPDWKDPDLDKLSADSEGQHAFDDSDPRDWSKPSRAVIAIRVVQVKALMRSVEEIFRAANQQMPIAEDQNERDIILACHAKLKVGFETAKIVFDEIGKLL